MLLNMARGLGELLRPLVEMAAALSVVLMICVLAGMETESGPEYQDGLIAASQSGDIRQIDRAVQGGTSLEVRDHDGLTPLMIAARSGQSDVVKRLILSGAKVNAISDEFGTALMLACRNEKAEAVRLLLDAGADPKLADERGNTAETWAMESSSSEIRKLIFTPAAR